jgi:outer membrane receptor for ferrienterochelin and colicin
LTRYLLGGRITSSKAIFICSPLSVDALKIGVLLTFILLIVSTSLCAQGIGNTTGTASGDVTDQTGSPLKNVLISVIGAVGANTTTTDERGKYIFPYLNPGQYNFRAELAGFTTIEQNDVRIQLGQRTVVSFKMKPTLEELVTVSSDSQRLDLTSTKIATNISKEIIQKIPMGRSIANIIFLAPGVVDAGPCGANFSISGASGTENTYLIDGAVVTDPGFGGLGTITIGSGIVTGERALPLDAINEVQIITAGFDPEYGQVQGGIINVISKSGGNDFHGAAHFYGIPNNVGTLLGRGNYGLDSTAEIGGAILKNKLFFYTAYNWTSSKTTTFLNPEWPGYAVLKESENKNISNAYSLKLSANLTAQHSLTFTASGGPTFQPLANQFGYGLDTYIDPRKAQSEWRMGTDNQVLRWNGTLRENMFLEAQFAHAHNWFKDTPNPEFKDEPAFFDHTQGDGGLDIGGYGGNFNSAGNNLQYNAKFTNLWKNHQFHYGIQFEDVSFDFFPWRTGAGFTLPTGEIITNGYRVDAGTGEDFGLPMVYVVSFGIESGRYPTTSKHLSWFVQDSWNLKPDLNIQLGVRWEQQHLQGDLKDAPGLTFANNWAPRLGITYDYLKNSNSKLFLNYGRFFEQVSNFLAVNLMPLVSYQAFYADANLTNLLEPPTLFDAGQNPFWKYVEVEGSGNSKSPFRPKAQFSEEWSGGIEQEVKQGFVLGAHIVYRKLARVVDDYQIDPSASCIPDSNGDCITAPLRLEDWDSFSSKSILTNVDGHVPGLPEAVRDYKALEITAEKRFSDRWMFFGSYRYARLTGNYEGGDQNVGSSADFALSALTKFNYLEGPLRNDIRHMVKLFNSYQVMNNLNASVAFYFQTGRPINPLGALQTSIGISDQYYLLFPRGSFGRTDSITRFDVHADYGLNVFRNQLFTFGLDIFNLFNAEGILDVNQVKEIQGDSNSTFLDPTDVQGSRTFRILLRYSF